MATVGYDASTPTPRLTYTFEDGTWLVGDSQGYVWGEGTSLLDAVDDWTHSCREVLTMLDGAGVTVSDDMGRRRATLRQWAARPAAAPSTGTRGRRIIRHPARRR